MCFKWGILPKGDHNQGIFPKIKALFSNFRKRTGETFLPPVVTLLLLLQSYQSETIYRSFEVLKKSCFHKWQTVVSIGRFRINHGFLQVWKPSKLPGRFYFLSYKGKDWRNCERKTHHHWSLVLLYLLFPVFY